MDWSFLGGCTYRGSLIPAHQITPNSETPRASVAPVGLSQGGSETDIVTLCCRGKLAVAGKGRQEQHRAHADKT